MMDTNKILEKYGQSLSSDEKYIGHINGMIFPLKWIILLGPLGVFFTKYYVIIVSDKRIHFNRLNQLGKVAMTDSFDYDEIDKMEITKGVIKYAIKVYFKNGKTFYIKAQHRAINKKISERLVSPDAIAYLKEKFKC